MAVLIGGTTKSYISSISFLDRRDIMEEVLNVTNEDVTFLDVMELTGRMKVTEQPSFNHFQNQYVMRKGIIASISGTASLQGDAAGETLEFTLTAGTDTGLPVVSELALFQNKKVGHVISVNTSTRVVQVVPVPSTDTLNPGGTAIAADQVVSFFSQASAEGTSNPNPRKFELKRSENYIQIFKETAQISDLQKVSTVEVKFGGKPFVMYKLQHDALMRHRLKIAGALIAGKKAKWTDSVTGNEVYTTQGLRNYILSGDSDVLTTGGVDKNLGGADITRADIRNVNRTLDKRGAPNEYMAFCGGELRADIDEVITQLPGILQNQSYTAFGSGDAKKRAFDLGVDSFKLYNRTWHLKTMAFFDHPEMFGAENGANSFNFPNEAYLVPAGKIKIDTSGNQEDRICVRYMSGDGTDLKYLETLTGKLAPTPTSDEAILKVSYQSVMGLQVNGVDHFALIR